MTEPYQPDVLAAAAARARLDLAAATLARPVPPRPLPVRRPRPVWRRLRSPAIAGFAAAIFVLGILVGIGLVRGRMTDPYAVFASAGAGDRPVAVATDGRTIWAADSGSGRILALDAVTMTPRWSVPVGPHPVGVAYGLGALWVVDSGDRQLRKLDPSTGHLLSQANSSLDPAAVVVTQLRVWVLAVGNTTVDGYNPQTLRQDRSALGFRTPTSVTVDSGVLWIAAADGLFSCPESGGEATNHPISTPVELVAAAGGRLWATTPDGQLLGLDPSTGDILSRTALPGRATAIVARGTGVAVATQDGTVSWIRTGGAEAEAIARPGTPLTSLALSSRVLVGTSPDSALVYRMETPS